MYRVIITDQFLSLEERSIFQPYLDHLQLDANIWEVFQSFFNSSVPGTQPRLLKVYEHNSLEAAVILLRCSNYGKALFQNPILSGLINSLAFPFYLWVRLGCCMDMLSNPGFVRQVERADEIYLDIANYLRKNTLLTIINDYSINADVYPSAAQLPALPHALVDCSDMQNVGDYLATHKNLRKKLNRFRNKGGTYEIKKGSLVSEELKSLKQCFVATIEKSVFYLPYQDIYLKAALNTSSRTLEDVYYFIARLNGQFIGYQAALKTGKHLNALHGAFDRRLKSNFHAYNVLFVQMTQFAIENRLSSIDFGAVLNVTKKRMVNETRDMSYFILSKYAWVRSFFRYFLTWTKIQSREQLTFR